MLKRRGLLLGAFAALSAPAIVRADGLMRVAAPRALTLWGGGERDDSDAIAALLNGTAPVRSAAGLLLAPGFVPEGVYRICSTVQINRRPLFMLRSWQARTPAQ